MRRPLTVGAVSTCLLLAACAGDDDQATPTGSADTVTVVVTETVATTGELQVEAGMGDTLTLISPGGAQISATLRGVVDPAPFEQPLGPPEGTRLVAVELRIVTTLTRPGAAQPS